nr:MAG TPA: hypothetical protein [Caudoviricetes sp.]
MIIYNHQQRTKETNNQPPRTTQANEDIGKRID